MKQILFILFIVAALQACNNETTTEATKADTAAMITVDSVKQEMNEVEDSSRRALDSIKARN